LQTNVPENKERGICNKADSEKAWKETNEGIHEWNEGGTVSGTRKVIRDIYTKLENAAVQSLQLRAIVPTSLILKLLWVAGGDSSLNGGSFCGGLSEEDGTEEDNLASEE